MDGVRISTQYGRALVAAGVLIVTGAVVGGAFGALGAGLGSENVVVPITPCRLVDTRPGADNVGTRSTPLPTKTLVEFAAHGSIGNCTVPASASALVANVTIVNPTARSYLTLYNSDAASRPKAANLNWDAGQLPTPNQATIPLSPDGRFTAYNHDGTVDMVVDVVGYYQTSTNVGATGPPGPPGPAGDPERMWAAIDGTGADVGIIRSEGVVSLAHVMGSSQYRVIFDRDVLNCAWMATVSDPTGNDGSWSTVTARFIATSHFAGDSDDTVFVETKNNAGSFAQADFFLAVFC